MQNQNKKTKINPKLLSQCTESWRIVIILSANLSIPLNTDLQLFLDDENRYVLDRKKRGKNMPSRKALVKWVPYFSNTFATTDSSK
jgi:hypothetical protein